MQVERVPTANGVDDIKLIGETELERQFIKQLAEAGTLSCINRNVSESVVFRAISVMEEFSSYSSKKTIGKYNFSLRQNESHSFDLSFNSDDLPIDLRQYPTIKLQVKKSKTSSPIIQLDLTAGLQISGPDHNVLKVAFTSSQTKLLACETYNYDVLMSKPNQNVYYLEGLITVKKSITI